MCVEFWLLCQSLTAWEQNDVKSVQGRTNFEEFAPFLHLYSSERLYRTWWNSKPMNGLVFPWRYSFCYHLYLILPHMCLPILNQIWQRVSKYSLWMAFEDWAIEASRRNNLSLIDPSKCLQALIRTTKIYQQIQALTFNINTQIEIKSTLYKRLFLHHITRCFVMSQKEH